MASPHCQQKSKKAIGAGARAEPFDAGLAKRYVYVLTYGIESDQSWDKKFDMHVPKRLARERDLIRQGLRTEDNWPCMREI